MMSSLRKLCPKILHPRKLRSNLNIFLEKETHLNQTSIFGFQPLVFGGVVALQGPNLSHEPSYFPLNPGRLIGVFCHNGFC